MLVEIRKPWRRKRERERIGERLGLGKVELYVSHGATSDELGEWFIVEPRDDPLPQVESLRDAGRTVVKVKRRRRMPSFREMGPGSPGAR